MGVKPWPPELRRAPRGTCSACGAETRAWSPWARRRCTACWGALVKLSYARMTDAACLALYGAVLKKRARRR